MGKGNGGGCSKGIKQVAETKNSRKRISDDSEISTEIYKSTAEEFSRKPISGRRVTFSDIEENVIPVNSAVFENKPFDESDVNMEVVEQTGPIRLILTDTSGNEREIDDEMLVRN